MKFNLITLAILLNITFLVSGKSKIHQNVLRKRRQTSTTILPNVKLNTDDSTTHIVPDPTEQPDRAESTATTTTDGPEDDETTTENASTSTTSKNDERNCPKDQSSFSKHDLFAIVRYIAEVKFNILPNISDAYHEAAIHVRDELLKEYNEFLTKLENRPEHLIDVLDDMKDTREKKIVPLVKTAAFTLQEISKTEDEFDSLVITTKDTLNNLEQYKKICEFNNCNHQLRSAGSFPLRSGFIVSQSNDADYMCTSIEMVYSTVQERLLSFEQTEIKRITNYVTGCDERLNEGIANLKQTIREAAVSQFGTTMYDILTLNDDHFHFMKSLLDFNEKSYTSALTKTVSTIKYKLIDLDEKVEKYRQHCLTCNKMRRRRSGEIDLKTDEPVLVKGETILDEIINAKIIEIAHVVQSNVDDIFQEVINIVNNKEFVDNTIASLKPIQEAVSIRSEVEKKELEALMTSVQMESREHVQDTYLKSQEVVRSIEDAINFLQN